MTDDEVPITEAEMVALIRWCGERGERLDFAFGPGWVALCRPTVQALAVLADMRQAKARPTAGCAK